MPKLFDGNAYTRFELERDPTGLAPRSIFEKAFVDPPYTQFWCWDPPDGSQRRRKLYPDYKAKRKPMGEDVRATLELVKQLLAKAPVFQLEVPGYEADDTLASLALRAKPCAIYSHDGDFVQLTVIPGIVCGAKPKCEPRDVRLYKLCVGDPSDNIPGIKGFGEGTWEACDRGELRAVINLLFNEAPITADDITDHLPVRKGTATWMVENRDLLRTFWTIIGFFDVPEELMAQHMTKGTPDRAAGEALLRSYLL